ncbi:AraC-like DNA-binding protein [Afipia massiliensis]|uniref:AraC-like DNA-binding protein n=1 Tax=Afipia massiliensis TaxID=211460 RepID=A0A840N991_9BRAD|nr:AraC family transcriptional regulator [Afipia massiliensis]MBB5054271.1 AraC-like DNA-binding protein [Afipia massiliensis]
MISFSTDDLRPQDRFDHWCEVRGKSLFGVTIELERERRANFHGRFSAVTIGNAVVAEMTASSYRVGRTPADIARVASNSLSIGYQIRGPGYVDIGRGQVHRIREGDFTVSHSEQPFMGTPERSDGFHFRTLKIPLSSDILLGARAHDLAPGTLDGNTKFTRLIAAMFAALSDPHEPAASPEDDVQHIARLALLARGRLATGLPESRAALRAGYLHAARAIMKRNLHRPDLSPATVAAEIAISLRQVHVLFEPTGLSFARTLTAMRLEEARRQLQTMPARSVAEIAYACGFDSIATFYRVFRSAYGMTPGDVRMNSLNA